MRIRCFVLVYLLALGIAGCSASGGGGTGTASVAGLPALPPQAISQHPTSVTFVPYVYPPGHLVALAVGYNGIPYAADSQADLVLLTSCAFQTESYALPNGSDPAGSYPTIATEPNGTAYTSTGLFLDFQVGHWSPFAVKYAPASSSGNLVDLQGFNSFSVYLTATPNNVLYASLPDTTSITAVTNVGAVTSVNLSEDAIPGPIVSDTAGNAWATASLTTSSEVLVYSQALKLIKTIPLPPIHPSAATWGADGALWYVDSQANTVGRISPSGALSRFIIPTPGSGASSITSGPDGAVWISESNAAKIARVTKAGSFTEFATPGLQPGPIAGAPVGVSVSVQNQTLVHHEQRQRAGAGEDLTPFDGLRVTRMEVRVTGMGEGNSPFDRLRVTRMESDKPKLALSVIEATTSEWREWVKQFTLRQAQGDKNGGSG